MFKVLNFLSKRLRLSVVIGVLAAATVIGYLFAAPLLVSSSIYLKTAPELLNLDNYTVTSDSGQQNPTVLTVWLRNDGALSTTLSTLSVKGENPNSNPVSFQMNGLTIDPGTTKSITVDTVGSGFYFSHGILYTVTVTTTRAILTYSITG
jgi:hypothetical protein